MYNFTSFSHEFENMRNLEMIIMKKYIAQNNDARVTKSRITK